VSILIKHKKRINKNHNTTSFQIRHVG